MSKQSKKTKKIARSSTKKQLEYLFILDRSGSMSCVRTQTVNNVNEQINVIKEQSALNGVDTNITVLLFDSRGLGTNQWFKYLFNNRPVKDVQHITEADYEPHGGTPLRDAIGYGVTELQNALGDKLGSPNIKILVNIFTDGEENTSQKYSAETIKKMIEHLSADGKFVFTFIGAGTLDAVTKTSQNFGIKATNTMAYENNLSGHKMASQVMSRSVCSFMTGYAGDQDVSADYFASSPALDMKVSGDLMKNSPEVKARIKQLEEDQKASK